MENVEHPTGDQEPAIAESSLAEERVECAGSADHHSIDQCSEGAVPNADAPGATFGGTMGVMLGAGTSNDNPATKGDALEAAAIEEELEIEDINHAPMETVQPQCIHIARKHHSEWVFHEEDNSNRAMHKL
jgi:uncharacterized protein YcfJ